MTAEELAIIGAAIIGWLLISERAERANISSAFALVVIGLLVANGPWAPIHTDIHAEALRTLAEVTLSLVLFSDAARVDLRSLRNDMGVPIRLLAIGLPLTILLGIGSAALIIPGTGLWVAATIAAIVAPTDAALGAPILVDERLPERIRRALNVESGLNDGIATPFVNVCLAAAAAGALGSGHGVRSALSHLAIGALVGIAAGWGGGRLLRLAEARGTMAANAHALAVLFLAGLSYVAAVAVDGNGFIAAFVAGLAFGGTLGPTRDGEPTKLTVEAAEGLTLVVWFAFGATLLVPAVRHARPGDVLFAVLALTVIRMVPVALSLWGTGLDRPTVALIGWFGPRGLASVVFTLLAVDSLGAGDAQRVLSAASVTVALSVIAHGVSAAPIGHRYGRWRARTAGGRAGGSGEAVSD